MYQFKGKLEIHTWNSWLLFKAPWNWYIINDNENIKIFTQVFLWVIVRVFITGNQGIHKYLIQFPSALQHRLLCVKSHLVQVMEMEWGKAKSCYMTCPREENPKGRIWNHIRCYIYTLFCNLGLPSKEKLLTHPQGWINLSMF